MIEYSPPPQTCHLSHVMCHVSCVTCHMSHVTCHIIFILFYFYFFLQSGEAYQWRVGYQRGLPRLVLFYFNISKKFGGKFVWVQ